MDVRMDAGLMENVPIPMNSAALGASIVMWRILQPREHVQEENALSVLVVMGIILEHPVRIRFVCRTPTQSVLPVIP
jgi:hypothetical protein